MLSALEYVYKIRNNLFENLEYSVGSYLGLPGNSKLFGSAPPLSILKIVWVFTATYHHHTKTLNPNLHWQA
jgi:hypothetical protein